MTPSERAPAAAAGAASIAGIDRPDAGGGDTLPAPPVDGATVGPDAADAAAPRRLHPFTLVSETIRIARAFVIPAIAGALGAAADGVGRTVAVGLGILAVPALVAAIAKYAGSRYRLAGDELILDSGVLHRRRRVIPLARIQNVDVRQKPVERIFRVAELRIETAGGRKTEGVLSVLGRDAAHALRTELLQRRDRAAAADGAAPPRETLVRLSTADVVIAGATANEIGLVAAALGGAIQFLEDAVARAIPRIDPATLIPAAPALAVVLLALAAVAVLLLAGWLLSVAGSVLGYHGFTLERIGGELHKRYGLLARREGSVPLRRVQAVRIEESPLRRPFGLAAVRIETAGAAPARRRATAEAFVPLVRRRTATALVARIFDGFDAGAVRLRPVHPRARRRIFLRHAAPIAIVAAGLALLVHPAWLALLLLLGPAHLWAGHAYRARGFAIEQDYVVARDGVLNRTTWIIPVAKIQTLHVVATPLQRRHGLATLVVDTASGGRRGVATIADLARGDAASFLEELAQRAARRGSGQPGAERAPVDPA
ncbi:MAG TPA: PH domain-containing protein [Longimicrobiales bacterium]